MTASSLCSDMDADDADRGSADEAEDTSKASGKKESKPPLREPIVTNRRKKYEMWCGDDDELLQYCLGQPGFLKIEEEEMAGMLDCPSDVLQPELDATKAHSRCTCVGPEKIGSDCFCVCVCCVTSHCG